MPDPTEALPLPDPDAIRARLAVIAREQAVLRKLLRVIVRNGYRPATAPATPQQQRGVARAQ